MRLSATLVSLVALTVFTGSAITAPLVTVTSSNQKTLTQINSEIKTLQQSSSVISTAIKSGSGKSSSLALQEVGKYQQGIKGAVDALNAMAKALSDASSKYSTTNTNAANAFSQ